MVLYWPFGSSGRKWALTGTPLPRHHPRSTRGSKGCVETDDPNGQHRHLNSVCRGTAGPSSPYQSWAGCIMPISAWRKPVRPCRSVHGYSNQPAQRHAPGCRALLCWRCRSSVAPQHLCGHLLNAPSLLDRRSHDRRPAVRERLAPVDWLALGNYLDPDLSRIQSKRSSRAAQQV